MTEIKRKGRDTVDLPDAWHGDLVPGVAHSIHFKDIGRVENGKMRTSGIFQQARWLI